MKSKLQKNINKTNKLFKYLIMGIIMYGATKYIPDTALPEKELLMLATISSILLALLDMISPSITVEEVYN